MSPLDTIDPTYQGPLSVFDGRDIDTCRQIRVDSGCHNTIAVLAPSNVGIVYATLFAASLDLLALAKQYASECSGCSGHRTISRNAGVRAGFADVEVQCPDCADIWRVIDKAEGLQS